MGDVALAGEARVVVEHLHAHDVVFISEEVFLDFAQEVFLHFREAGLRAQLGDEAVDGAVDAFLVAREGGADGRAADEADDVGGEVAFRAAGVGLGELALAEVGEAELLAQGFELAPREVARARAGEAQGLDLVAVLPDPAGEGLEVVLGARLALAVAARDGGDAVGARVDDDGAFARAVDAVELLDGGAVREQDGAGALRREGLYGGDEVREGGGGDGEARRAVRG